MNTHRQFQHNLALVKYDAPSDGFRSEPTNYYRLGVNASEVCSSLSRLEDLCIYIQLGRKDEEANGVCPTWSR